MSGPRGERRTAAEVTAPPPASLGRVARRSPSRADLPAHLGGAPVVWPSWMFNPNDARHLIVENHFGTGGNQ